MKLSEKLKTLNMKILAREKCGRAFVSGYPSVCNSNSQIEFLSRRKGVNTHFSPAQFISYAHERLAKSKAALAFITKQLNIVKHVKILYTILIDAAVSINDQQFVCSAEETQHPRHLWG